MAATSHIGGRRFARPRKLKDYEAWVRASAEEQYRGFAQAASARGSALADEEAEERLSDALMLVRWNFEISLR